MRKKRSSRRGRGDRPRSGRGTVPLSPPPAAPEVPRLLAAFQALSPTDLYMMAPKDSVVRGYHYYEQQRLQSYAWSSDRSTLTAWVQGSRLYAVAFSLSDEMLDAQCDCPAWNPDWSCKHVLCGYFTTVNLLSPETFKVPAWRQARLPALRAELLGDIPEPSGKSGTTPSGAARKGAVRKGPVYEIVIDVRQAYPRLLIRRDGAPLTGGWAPALAPELVPLLNTSWFSSGFSEDPLLHYLRLHDKPYPIVLETGQESMPLQWNPSVTCRSKTEIDLIGDQVRIRAVCLAAGTALERIARFRTFVADLSGGRLLFLEDESGWASYRSLRQLFHEVDPFLHRSDDLDKGPRAVTLPDGSGYGRWQGISRDVEFAVPLDEFRAAQVDLIQKQADRTLRDLLFKLDGREVPVQRLVSLPEGEAPSYHLILKPPPDTGDDPTAPWVLQAECRRGDLRYAPSVSTFAFIAALEQGRAVSGPLRAQKRKAVLYDTWFTLLSVQDSKQRDHRIKTALAPEYWSRAVSNEAYRWLRHHLSLYARPDERLLIREGRWELMPIDKSREALLYRIPFELFGPQMFYGASGYDRMRIEAPRLFQRLPELLEKLTDAGVPLLCEEAPVRPSRWDCALDVGRRAGIDWFEVRPEIRCDGAIVEEAVWQEAARRGGLVRTEGGLRLLDAASLERLRALANLSEQAARGRGAARIVRVPRLQIFDWMALREQGIRVSLPAEEEAVLSRLLGFERGSTRRRSPKGCAPHCVPISGTGMPGWRFCTSTASAPA